MLFRQDRYSNQWQSHCWRHCWYRCRWCYSCTDRQCIPGQHTCFSHLSFTRTTGRGFGWRSTGKSNTSSHRLDPHQRRSSNSKKRVTSRYENYSPTPLFIQFEKNECCRGLYQTNAFRLNLYCSGQGGPWNAKIYVPWSA